MLRREFITSMGAAALLAPHLASAAVREALPPEGVELIYRVIYGGNEIGTQTVRIRDHDEDGHVVIEHEMTAEVRVLFARVYALDHKSTEVWEGFRLKSLRSETIENDQRAVIEGEAAETGFRVRNGEQDWLVPEGAVPTDSFWLAAALESSHVINTRTGESAKPVVEKLADDRWHLKAAFDHGEISATMHFDGDFLDFAEIDSGGHTVTLTRA